MAEPERLQKVLARAGLGSRRACEVLIERGRVTVDDVTARLGTRVDVDNQRVALDGSPVVIRGDLVYYLLNKPPRVVTTASDPEGRRTAVELVPREPRVFPVGRLDYETEGLLLLTNDGDLAQLLTHPSHGVEKTYLAEVDGMPGAQALRCLRTGVELEDGLTAPATVRVVQRGVGRAALEITVHEGKNRQVRRMCEAVGHPVRRLVRTAIGALRDDRLAPGAWRRVESDEVHRLYRAATDAGTTAAVDPRD